MSVDVDAVNERLNGLVTLLKAVGVDGEAAKGVAMGNPSANGEDPAMDMARQLNDDQIEAIIKKLQEAQTEAPQIIAALEAHAEARSLNQTAEEVEEEVVEEEVVEEEQVVEEVEEDEDDFDEDANYPMVGHGVSDDISVVSDLTTPTVVPELHVPEEEHYKETLPPMIVGGPGEPSMIIAATKKKNLVSQVRPVAGVLAPPGSRRNIGVGVGYAGAGGAAAARRKMYQDTMAKLHENPNGMGYVGPSAAPITPPAITPSKPKTTGNSSVNNGGTATAAAPKAPAAQAPAAKTSKKKTTTSKKSGSGASGGQEWGASFDDPKKSSGSANNNSKGQTVIDDDGFLVGDTGGFDPFSTGSNPFKSSAAGDLEFGAAAKNFMSDHSAPGGFGFQDGAAGSVGGSSSKPRKSKSKKSSGSGEREHSERKSTRSSTNGRSGTTKRASRRASAV